MEAARRTDWFDTARGLAISLVVLLHASEWLDTAGCPSPFWATFHDLVNGVRMPLFFAVSGMLAARRVRGSWRDLVSDRLLFLAWVYLVWQLIGSASALVAAQITGDVLTPVRMLGSLALTVVRPRFELWFLWALMVFLVLARATRNVPVCVQMGLATALSAVFLSDLVPEVNLGWNGIPRFYLFFLIGLQGRDLLLRSARNLTPSLSAGLVALWAGCAVAAQVAGIDGVLGVGLAVRLAGLLAGVVLAVRLSWFRPLRALGSRTLPVYLAHTPLIVLAVWGLTVLAPDREVGPVLNSTVVSVPLAAWAIAVSLLLHRFLRDGRTAWLYRPPAGLVRLLASS